VDAVDLSGTWTAAIADEGLRREYPSPDFDDTAWESITVPSHWRSTPAFDSTDGPLLARRRFSHDRLAPGRRAWLVFDGIFYQSDVWLDGAYVGDTEGYFAPHTFEVTDALRDHADHTLAVEVTCSPQLDRKNKRNLTGVFQHWDCFDPAWNPGGIWRPVRLSTTGPVAITRLRATCLEATAERALFALDADVDAPDAVDVRVVTRIEGTEHADTQQLARGANRVEWRVTVDNPTLWWPHALGDARLVDLTVIVRTDAGESDRRTLRTGVRQVRMDDWVLSVNGERLFLKGANQGPNEMALGAATSTSFERDVVTAKDAGLDMVRVHAHVSRPELYDAADRHGMLLWQDLPLQWGYARSVRKQAVRQARQAVDMLGHHPSVAMWCAHNEPISVDIEPGGQLDIAKTARATAVASVLPTYNKTILDGSLHRALHRADRSRPVMAHSGVLGRTDAHLYFGWYHGHERDLPRLAAAWPRAVRFVSEFGAQAVPATDDFIDRAETEWPELDWEALGSRHALQRSFMARHGLEPTDFATFDAWRDATQEYQATVIKHHVETLRRLKYRPTGGFAQFSLADGWPAITWSVLDHKRVPKRGFDALKTACAPVIVVADRPEAAYTAGDAIALDIHVVSDLRDPIEDARVTARLRWPGGDHEWHWEGDVPADGVTRVGTIQAVAPETSGPLTLTLSFESPKTNTSNTYTSEIL
jgi:beta-mannosidase